MDDARRRSLVRWLVRGTLLAAAVLALLPVVEGTILPLVVPALSPFVAINSMIALRAFWAAMGIGLVVGAVAVAQRRWFCRWVCPTGTCAEVAARAGLRVGLRCPAIPPVGQWIALAAIGGALLGYPVLLWLDPLAMFGGAFAVLGPATGKMAWIGVAALAAVLLVSFIAPGLWCARLCPLGGTQEILYSLAPWRVRPAATQERAPSRGRGQLGRRAVLASVAGIGWVALGRSRAAASRPMRPPGAVDEDRFLALCIRCGNCLRACPTQILQPDSAGRLSSLLTPVVSFQKDYCLETCTLCTQVCPSGALERLPLDRKPEIRMGLPKVDMNVCLLGDNRECAVCRSRCPYEAIAYVFDEEEYTLVPRIAADRCNGCGACEANCPTQPRAIVVGASRGPRHRVQ